MLNWIIGFSLKNRILVLAAAVVIAGYGLYTSTRIPIDVLPDLNRPTVTIMTEVHGMVPEEVERRVTRPLEQAMNGATGVTRVRSDFGKGLSIVYVEFGWETDIFRNRQIVQEKLQLVQSRLPEEAKAEMSPISSIMGQIQLIGIQSKSGTTDLSTVRALTDQQIRPRLLSIAGVAQIVTIGGAPRQLQVTVDADKLRSFDVTLNEVAEAIRGANINASGGAIVTVKCNAQVVTTPVAAKDGAASQFEATDAALKADPLKGRIAVTIKGKKYNIDIKEAHDHDHK